MGARTKEEETGFWRENTGTELGGFLLTITELHRRLD